MPVAKLLRTTKFKIAVLNNCLANAHASEPILLLSRRSISYCLAARESIKPKSLCSLPILLEARLPPSVKTDTPRQTHKATILESTFMNFDSRKKQTQLKFQ